MAIRGRGRRCVRSGICSGLAKAAEGIACERRDRRATRRQDVGRSSWSGLIQDQQPTPLTAMHFWCRPANNGEGCTVACEGCGQKRRDGSRSCLSVWLSIIGPAALTSTLNAHADFNRTWAFLLARGLSTFDRKSLLEHRHKGSNMWIGAFKTARPVDEDDGRKGGELD